MRTSPTGRSPPATAGGYTLIELLVVLAIMALIATLATPLIGRGIQSELRAASEEISAELAAARGRAVHGNTAAAVGFDTRRHEVLGPAGEVMVKLPAGTAMRIVTAERERLSETTGSIRFFPDGSSTGGRITLLRADRRMEITVDWFDGAIEIGDATQ